jgi:hypothetical protein
VELPGEGVLQEVENFMFIRPRHIWLAEKPDGILQRPISITGPKGQRVALAASEYVTNPKVKIRVHLLPHPELTWDIVELLLDYGEFEGISQWRSGGFGQFSWTRLDVE